MAIKNREYRKQVVDLADERNGLSSQFNSPLDKSRVRPGVQYRIYPDPFE